MKRFSKYISDFVFSPAFLLVVLVSLLVWSGGSSGNLDWLKERADAKWKAQGFEVVDYEGYGWGSGGFGTSYGGAKVWHRLRKSPDNGVYYSGYIRRWGNEVHVYGPEALSEPVSIKVTK